MQRLGVTQLKITSDVNKHWVLLILSTIQPVKGEEYSSQVM
jgi:hypothetical protein